ncbi:hypothetical protein LMG33818_000655 [Halomonadaceae bacterium LMG 33818]
MVRDIEDGDVYMSVAKAEICLGRDCSHEFLFNMPSHLITMIVKRYVGKQCFQTSFPIKSISPVEIHSFFMVPFSLFIFIAANL